MKGMMSFLEKTGFVRAREGEGAEFPPDGQALPPDVVSPIQEPVAPVEQTLSLSLEQIYAQASVPPSSYPAEKLLRLLDGLRMMDEATRRQAVQAMDAADDNWTIEDPIRDAIAKVQALTDHGHMLRSGVDQAERDTRALIAQVKDREATSVADIRRQIADLEGLLAREIARAAQESAEMQAAMQVKREGVARSIEQLTLASTDLRRLITQFGSAPQGSATSNTAAPAGAA